MRATFLEEAFLDEMSAYFFHRFQITEIYLKTCLDNFHWRNIKIEIEHNIELIIMYKSRRLSSSTRVVSVLLLLQPSLLFPDKNSVPFTISKTPKNGFAIGAFYFYELVIRVPIDVTHHSNTVSQYTDYSVSQYTDYSTAPNTYAFSDDSFSLC